MNTETLDKPKYTITYSNHFELNNCIFAYRKKILFYITNIPTALFCVNNNGCLGYWINRKWISESTIKAMVVIENIEVDVSDLQWYQQEQLNHVFNLK